MGKYSDILKVKKSHRIDKDCSILQQKIDNQRSSGTTTAVRSSNGVRLRYTATFRGTEVNGIENNLIQGGDEVSLRDWSESA